MGDNGISFNEKSLNLDDFNEYDNISGVWALWETNKETEENICLTAGQTINICKELRWTLRVLANQNLQQLEIETPGCTGRWNLIQLLHNNFEYKIIGENIENFDEREIMEATYAIINNSPYWKPSPTQTSNKFLNKIKEL